MSLGGGVRGQVKCNGGRQVGVMEAEGSGGWERGQFAQFVPFQCFHEKISYFLLLSLLFIFL